MPKTLLIISQVYVPDPASVGQHMHDAAVEMSARGYRVVVLTARSGYNDPSIRYPKRERLEGVEVRRLPLSSFGKRSIAVRLLGGTIFLLQVVLRGVFIRRLCGVLVSTSPPMCAAAGLVIQFFRRTPLTHWAMDLNPDQLIVLGKLRERSWLARVFELLNRLILRRAARVVALDRFMAERLERKTAIGPRLLVIPPWPHVEASDAPVPHEENPFRKEHGLDGKFVFMYSGNHGILLPMETFLKAAVEFKDDPRLVFLFVGDGIRKREVEQTIQQYHMTNMLSLPYQPLETLRYSLSAADIHLVTMANDIVGVIHPCKIYGAMAVGRPILLIGPEPCHISDIITQNHVGWRIRHGDVAGAVQCVRAISQTDATDLDQMGRRARQVISEQFSRARLGGQLGDAIEAAVRAGEEP